MGPRFGWPVFILIMLGWVVCGPKKFRTKYNGAGTKMVLGQGRTRDEHRMNIDMSIP